MPSASAARPHDEFLGHPKGLFVCFFTEMWERFSFYGMKALLLLYLLKFHLFGDDAGYDVLGAYGGLVYAVPVLGGLLADRYLGMRKAVVFGGILLVLGHAGMAYEGHQARLVNGVVQRDEAALQVFYLSLALIIMGVGFLKPNISTIVGKLYPKDDPRRDSGFTVFYAGINVGALLSSLICAFLGETYGWKYGFGAAGLGMLAGLCVFLWGQKYLEGHAEPRDPAKLRERIGPVSREWAIYLGASLGVLLVWQLIQRTWTVHGTMHVIAALFLVWFVWFIATKCTKVEREQMLALATLMVGVLIFLTMYEQTYGSWVTFTDRLMTKDLFAVKRGTPSLPWAIFSLGASPPLMVAALAASDRGRPLVSKALGATMVAGLAVATVHDIVLVPQTAGSLTFLGPFFVVLFTPLFSWLWPWLELRGLNPSKPAKMATGLGLAGLAFLPMLAAVHSTRPEQPASVWWLALGYAVLEVGEIAVMPIGLSAVTQLSVGRVVGVMMGAFWLATAYAEVLSARFGKLASIDVSDGAAMDWTTAAAKYGDLFRLMAYVGVAAGVLYFVLTPWIRRAMHGAK
ncbi:oligopeptide:H+ symporter [Pendulispora brunnea]|uniref:Oligopeptide:H+ symporter n=1 Tax=Pendulispora brunnea TaxID=2905690 RepID=A0ABZ2JVI1_9BACT